MSTTQPRPPERYTCICVGPKRQSCIALVTAESATEAAAFGCELAAKRFGGTWWPAAALSVGSADLLLGMPGHHGCIVKEG